MTTASASTSPPPSSRLEGTIAQTEIKQFGRTSYHSRFLNELHTGISPKAGSLNSSRVSRPNFGDVEEYGLIRAAASKSPDKGADIRHPKNVDLLVEEAGSVLFASPPRKAFSALK